MKYEYRVTLTDPFKNCTTVDDVTNVLNKMGADGWQYDGEIKTKMTALKGYFYTMYVWKRII